MDALESRVVDDTQRTLDLLDRCGVRATCFVVGWVAERHPLLVARIRDAGHEIGSHCQWHRRVYELDPDEFTRDLRLASDALIAAGAPRPTQFRAPEWSINGRAPWARSSASWPRASPSTPAARRSASSEIPCIPRRRT